MESKDLFGKGIEKPDYLQLDRGDDITESKEIEEDFIPEGQLSFFPTGQLELFGEGSSSGEFSRFQGFPPRYFFCKSESISNLFNPSLLLELW